jgi:hypothetical protein
MKTRLDEVVAQWKSNGEIDPQNFIWQGRPYHVDSVGRSWRDEEGYHVLCMTADMQVYELILSAQGEWWILPPAEPRSLA